MPDFLSDIRDRRDRTDWRRNPLYRPRGAADYNTAECSRRCGSAAALETEGHALSDLYQEAAARGAGTRTHEHEMMDSPMPRSSLVQTYYLVRRPWSKPQTLMN